MKSSKFIIILMMGILFYVPLCIGDVVPRDFATETAKGNIKGHERAFKIGHNEEVGVNLEVIWPGPTETYPFLSSPIILNVTSTDVDDTAAGAGARAVFIDGLDGDYNEVNETVLMNGQTPVSTVNSYIRINQMFVVSVGTNFTNNQGVIYLGTGATVAGVPANVYYLIQADYGRDHVGIYTVPNGKTLVITSYTWTVYIRTGSRVENYLMAQPLFGNNRVTWRIWDLHSIDAFMDRTYSIPVNVAEKTDVFFIGASDQGTSSVSVSVNGYLIDNDVLNNSTLEWSDGTEGEVVTKSPSNNILLYLLVVIIILGLLAYGRRR